MRIPSHPVALLLVLWAAPLMAAGPMVPQELTGRIDQLEAEVRGLRAELQRLEERPVRLPGVATTLTSAAPTRATPASEEQEPEYEYYTWEQVQTEVKKLAWTKGDMRIVPYGYLWGNMVYESHRTAPITRSYTTWVPSSVTHGEDAFHFDGRMTRLGLDISGPRLWFFNCAQSGGKVEIDFQGAFLNTENKGGVLFRHAYCEVKDERYRLLIGQTWDVISPLVPGTILYSVYWNAGNIGYRRAQVRGERYLAFSETLLLTLQGSINQDVFSDFSTDGTVRAEPADWPVVEGRVAATLGSRGKHGLPITFGVSGHIGEQGFDILANPADPGQIPGDDVRRKTWSVNADLKIPITDRLGFQGEFFHGENLSTFLGGIGQGIDRATWAPIQSTGGWAEVYCYWVPWLHSHFGYGLDDPLDADVTTGRTYNQFFFGNIIYDVTEKFDLGFEVSSWKTLYATQPPGESVRIEVMAKYGF